MAILFWSSFAVVLYTYFGYPLALWALGRARPQAVGKMPFEPEVSVVLAACDEERNIVPRLENLLAQEYPSEKLEIIVVSDGSSDRTAQLARSVQGGRIRIVELAERKGKAVALNAGVAQAAGEIVVFCDARQTFDRDAVRQLVANFADETVGCVSGELMLHGPAQGGAKVEMGLYWRYEKWIRRAESSSGSLVGATGAIYAIRSSLYRELPQGTLLDDVLVPMRVVLQGFRTVFDGAARAHDVISQQISQEWTRKVRTLAGNWQLMALSPGLLLPWRNRCCWRFVSHKVLRLIVPVALGLLIVSGALLRGPLYLTATLVQIAFYGMAALGVMLPASRNVRIVNLSFFFLVMNAVALAGFWLWATGRSGRTWQPAYRKEGE